MSENIKTVQNDFDFIDINSIQAEKITAPRYSYWASVFRVFFRKKDQYSADLPVCPADCLQLYHSCSHAVQFLRKRYGRKNLQPDARCRDGVLRRRI